MSINFSLLFYLKKPKYYKSGPLPIYLRITVNGKQCECAVGREIEPTEWDYERKKAKGSREEAKALNNHLMTVSTKVKNIHTRMLDTGEDITPEDLRDEFDGKSKNKKWLVEIFQEHINEVQSLLGNGFSPNTLKTLNSSIKHLKAYILKRKGTDDIGIRKVDYNFIRDYDLYLRTKHPKCTPVSAEKYVKHLKKMTLRSLANGWISTDPYLHYKSNAKAPERTFLTKDEITIISEKDFDIERLNNVRDIFIFSCYTGLAYVDVEKLTPDHIATGDDGKQWIFTKRQKTETPSHIPLLTEALAIIERYKDHPVCVYKGILLPIYTNQRMNSYLKEIADHCKIKKRLTFHMARHTMGSGES